MCLGRRSQWRSALASFSGTSSFAEMFLPGAACIWHYTESLDLKLSFELELSGKPLHVQMFWPCFTEIMSTCGAPLGIAAYDCAWFSTCTWLFRYIVSMASSSQLESRRQRNIVTAGISYQVWISHSDSKRISGESLELFQFLHGFCVLLRHVFHIRSGTNVSPCSFGENNQR